MKTLLLLMLISISFASTSAADSSGQFQAGTDDNVLLKILDGQTNRIEISVDQNGQLALIPWPIIKNCDARRSCNNDNDCGWDGLCRYNGGGVPGQCICY